MAIIDAWILLSLTCVTLLSVYAQPRGGPASTLEAILSNTNSILTIFIPTGQQCNYGFLTQLQNAPRNEQSYFNRSILIPGMKFTCNGTIMSVTVRGAVRSGNETMKLSIWKENATEPGVYHKSKKIVLARSMCNRPRRYTCQLSDGMQVSVEPGDILGIEVPPRNAADFELDSVSVPGLTSYIFDGTDLPPTVDLCDGIDETEVQPLIMLGITRMDRGSYYYNNQPSRHSTKKIYILITGDSAGQTTSHDQCPPLKKPGNNAGSPTVTTTSSPSHSKGLCNYCMVCTGMPCIILRLPDPL